MDNYKKIINYVKKNNGVITTRKVEEMGVHKQYLKNLVDQNRLEHVERGVYIDVDAFEDRLFNLQTRFTKGIFSHDTALFLHNLTDRTPLKLTMTFPASYNTVNVKKRDVEVYKANPDIYPLSITHVKTNTGNSVRVYSMEKTLCDIVRGYSRVEKEQVVQAFQMYVRRNDKNLSELYRLAKVLKVDSKIRAYMDVLL